MSKVNPQMPTDNHSPHETSSGVARQDQFLDLLLDALAERQRERAAEPAASPPTAHADSPLKGPGALASTEAAAQKTDEVEEAALPQPGEPGWQPPEPVPSIGLGRTAWKLLLVALALVVLFNIPLTRHGVSLARVLPDDEALVIRDGLLLKGPGEEVYVLEDDKLRWISSLEAFERLGYDWDYVHEVDEAFLGQFELGSPLYVLLKCDGSPHIYRIEDGQKRWIKDIPTFEAQGHVWGDVHYVSCTYLHSIPDGPPIPVDADPPPWP